MYNNLHYFVIAICFLSGQTIVGAHTRHVIKNNAPEISSPEQSNQYCAQILDGLSSYWPAISHQVSPIVLEQKHEELFSSYVQSKEEELAYTYERKGRHLIKKIGSIIAPEGKFFVFDDQTGMQRVQQYDLHLIYVLLSTLQGKEPTNLDYFLRMLKLSGQKDLNLYSPKEWQKTQEELIEHLSEAKHLEKLGDMVAKYEAGESIISSEINEAIKELPEQLSACVRENFKENFIEATMVSPKS